jgi:hypothetical protein
MTSHGSSCPAYSDCSDVAPLVGAAICSDRYRRRRTDKGGR